LEFILWSFTITHENAAIPCLCQIDESIVIRRTINYNT
jgi:hypothetical protein